jgi:hypothetical protein
MEEISAKDLQAAHRPIEKCTDDRLGGLIACQGVQVILDRGSRLFFRHGEHLAWQLRAVLPQSQSDVVQSQAGVLGKLLYHVWCPPATLKKIAAKVLTHSSIE